MCRARVCVCMCGARRRFDFRERSYAFGELLQFFGGGGGAGGRTMAQKEGRYQLLRYKVHSSTTEGTCLQIDCIPKSNNLADQRRKLSEYAVLQTTPPSTLLHSATVASNSSIQKRKAHLPMIPRMKTPIALRSLNPTSLSA